jgi:hypothetical protein
MIKQEAHGYLIKSCWKLKAFKVNAQSISVFFLVEQKVCQNEFQAALVPCPGSVISYLCDHRPVLLLF